MIERPLLVFPEASVRQRNLRHGFEPKYHLPAPERQRDLLEPKFAALEQAFAARRAALRADPVGVEPEQVLVLETVGRIQDFVKAVRGIPGLEWLVEWDVDDIEADDDFYGIGEMKAESNEKRATLSGRLYLVMYNQTGLEQLLSLWRIFRDNPVHPQFSRGRARWGQLFRQLKDVRPWSAEDRLRETGLLQDWEVRVREGQERVRVEIELWFRASRESRERAHRRVQQLVEAETGRVLAQAVIPEIAYHGVLADLPIQAVEHLVVSRDIELVHCDQVMFFRPVGQMGIKACAGETSAVPARDFPPAPIGKTPVVALLDGLPLANHCLLKGRVVVDDPDNWSEDYPVSHRWHGTGMSSLILHGELDAPGTPLSRPLYVRPILKPQLGLDGSLAAETIPETVLPTDLIYRAVRRMLEGEGGEPPAAPDVKIINLSIGNPDQPFDRYPSALARLIDFLAWRYRVLFVVSAGNHPRDVELDIDRKDLDTIRKHPDKLAAATLTAVQREPWKRRLLSPAEAINALTVGALHEDRCTGQVGSYSIDPLPQGLPSLISAFGPGFRRSVKPEVVVAGGRQAYTELLGGGTTRAILSLLPVTLPPGQKVAAPGKGEGELNRCIHSRGTSNAAALVTRTAAVLYDVLEELRTQPGGERIGNAETAVLIKALLVHAATWQPVRAQLEALLTTDVKALLTRLIGYGKVSPERVYGCEEHRATLVGFGNLSDGQGHLYKIPLPPSLSGKAVWHRLVVTLAWLTPVNPHHSAYRKAALWFGPGRGNATTEYFEQALRVRRVEVDARATQRGTVQHEVFEGRSAVVFGNDANLEIQVNCRSEAGKLEERVPYGFAVTLEVGQEVDVPVYDEIRARIRPPVVVPVATPEDEQP